MHESLGEIIGQTLELAVDVSATDTDRRDERWFRWLVWTCRIVMLLFVVAVLAVIFWPR